MAGIKVLVGCQNDRCAEEHSYHLDMVKMWKGQPVCDVCYSEGYRSEGDPDWHDLPNVKMEDLVP